MSGVLPDDLREQLENRPIAEEIEHVAERLGCGSGHRAMLFYLTDGRLREGQLDHRRIRIEELETLARP
jgi:hypothetical protein